MQYDVAVIGAGVVGALIARELMKYKLSVIMLERGDDVGVGATKANSSIVHAGYDAHPGSLKAKLNVEGSRLMPALTRELGVKYKNIGSLVVAYTDEEEKTVRALVEQGRQNGVEGVCYVDAARLRELEPNISEAAVGALWAPTGAIVSPYGLCIAAAGNAMDNGAELRTGFEVTDIAASDDGFTLVSPAGRVDARYVVNASGIFSDKIAALVGDTSFTVHPRRGEYLLIDKELSGFVKHTIFRVPTKMGKGILISPSVDGNTILGPTAEDIEDKEDKSTTPEGLANVLNQTLAAVPKLNTRKVITSFAGLRAVGSTGVFIINSPRPRFVNVAAIESPGLSSAPAIAPYVVGILKDIGLELAENRDFSPRREPVNAFKLMSIEEKNKLIKKDGRYGRIVCRCEEVTEGEIVAAIHANPRPHDLDGIKRRLRSGMGRCQGGFCTPFITEILARELGVDETGITKNGPSSEFLCGRTKK